MMIDTDLQRECREKAIKTVAKRFNKTQAYVRKLADKPPAGKFKPREIYQYHLINAVKNWTVEFYHREVQKQYA